MFQGSITLAFLQRLLGQNHGRVVDNYGDSLDDVGRKRRRNRNKKKKKKYGPKRRFKNSPMIIKLRGI